MRLFLHEYTFAAGVGGEEDAAILLTQHNLSFKVTKTDKGDSNTATFEILNLSDSDKSVLSTKDQVVEFAAGYVGNIKSIFFGTIISASTAPVGQDVVTKIICKEAHPSLRDARTQRVFSPGTDLKSILTTIIKKDLELPLGELNGEGLDKIFKAGYTIDGPSKKAIEDLCHPLHLRFSTQDGIAYVIGKTVARDLEIRLITPSSGLLTAPEKTAGKEGDIKDSPTPEDGAKFRMLLDGELLPGSPVELQGREHSGIYKIVELTHTGTFHGPDWATSCKADLI